MKRTNYLKFCSCALEKSWDVDYYYQMRVLGCMLIFLNRRKFTILLELLNNFRITYYTSKAMVSTN